MFLFRTSGPNQAAPVNPVMDAIRQGADRTGVSFDYLVKTAQRESALDPEAKARTSSATGLFQFIDQTWLGMVRSEGAKHGLNDAAQSIVQGSDGRLSVPDAAMRDRIMALRKDPEIASTMAGAFTLRNAEQLRSSLGREPTGGELYIAHVLGSRGANELISSAQAAPQRVAAKDFPEAAAANRNIFFDKDGKARSASEVYHVLAAQHVAVANAPATSGSFAPPLPVSAAQQAGQGRGLMGLFSTEGSRKPVSDAVAALWSGQRSGAQGRLQLASLEPQQRFFPNAGGTVLATAPEAAARAPEVPAPPRRPVELESVELAKIRTRNRPLDLNAFLHNEARR